MSTLEAFDAREVGRKLGHDLFRFRVHVQEKDLEASVCEGYVQARGRGTSSRPADRYVRKWLQLRLNAHRRNRIVDDGVTPALLKSIDVPQCPVTKVALTHGSLLPTDWSVDRLNNDGAYVPNNLAVISTAANVAKGDLSYEQVYARSEQEHSTHGLSPVEWLRLATLMLGPCFASRPHLVPLIPLATPIPSHAVRPAVQQVQQVFTNEVGRPAGKNALIKHLKKACPDERSERRLRSLAEAIHVGMKGLDDRFEVWLCPGVVDAFVDWRASLDDPSWALVSEISRRLSGANHIPAGRLRSWHLATRGHAV